jgi:opacity protein-like surface antigen
MMRGTTNACLICTAAAILTASVQLGADGYVTPWVGLNVASETDDGRVSYGATCGYMAGGIFGFEADVSYSPEFFGSTIDFGRSNAITAMGNVILGVPIGGTDGAGVRPFISGGLGFIRTHIEAGTVVNVSRSNNEFAYDVGGGMMGFFSEHVGLRGEVRYLRLLHDTDRGSGVDLDSGNRRHWRASAGLTFR